MPDPEPTFEPYVDDDDAPEGTDDDCTGDHGDDQDEADG